MSDEYEYGPGWINVPPESRVECRTVGAEFFTVDRVNAYRIATPKPKREFVVGKWYRHMTGRWMQCIYTECEYGWMRMLPHNDAYRTPLSVIDWSTPPRDEAPE